MALLDCCPLKTIARATAKAAKARFRALGLVQTTQSWVARAETCETCPMRVIHNKVSYCGKPFQQQIVRDDALEGCGCPTIAKAKDPAEHCPIDVRHRPATVSDEGICNCRWCVRAASAVRSAA